jgi:hypothetical protein
MKTEHAREYLNIYVYGTSHSGEFNEPGSRLAAAGSIKVSCGSAIGIKPAGTNRLDENLGDLRPRACGSGEFASGTFR